MTKTLPHDVAEQLRSPEEVATYLEAWRIEAPDDHVGLRRAIEDATRAEHLMQRATTQ